MVRRVERDYLGDLPVTKIQGKYFMTTSAPIVERGKLGKVSTAKINDLYMITINGNLEDNL